jgi:hypothetical protein
MRRGQASCLLFKVSEVLQVKGWSSRAPVKAVSLVLLLLLIIVASGCAKRPVLTMVAEKELIDRSVSTPELGNMKYKRIMVITPQGTVRGQYDHMVAIFEREFLRKGVGVVAAAVTGRVVLESAGREETGGGQAVNLSDVERALVMAKKSGADAILQIGVYDLKSNRKSRFFVREIKQITYREVSQREFENSKDVKRVSFSSDVYHFIGRLIDVETGEVRASIDIESAANWNMPELYSANVFDKKDPILLNENYSYDKADWNFIKAKTVEKIATRIVTMIR